MKALNKLQQAFAADLWNDGLDRMQGLILDDKLSAARRFNVYRNNFHASLTDALAAIYPVVERLVGREFFDFMVNRYIRAFPSRSGNLHNLGHAMAGFLSRYQAVSKLPYLVDVARLEWAYHEVFHAQAAQSFNLDELQQMDAEGYSELRFSLGPACRLVCSKYPVFHIWTVNQEGHDGDDKINLNTGSESVLIIRPELEVELWHLDSADSTLLRSIENGKNFGEAVEASLVHSPDFKLQPSLARLLLSGALVAEKNQMNS